MDWDTVPSKLSLSSS